MRPSVWCFCNEEHGAIHFREEGVCYNWVAFLVPPASLLDVVDGARVKFDRNASHAERGLSAREQTPKTQSSLRPHRCRESGVRSPCAKHSQRQVI